MKDIEEMTDKEYEQRLLDVAKDTISELWNKIADDGMKRFSASEGKMKTVAMKGRGARLRGELEAALSAGAAFIPLPRKLRKKGGDLLSMSLLETDGKLSSKLVRLTLTQFRLPDGLQAFAYGGVGGFVWVLTDGGLLKVADAEGNDYKCTIMEWAASIKF